MIQNLAKITDLPTMYLQDVVMKNDSFTEYYKAQKLVPEAEWEDFMDALKSPFQSPFESLAVASSLSYATRDLLSTTKRSHLQTQFLGTPMSLHGSLTAAGLHSGNPPKVKAFHSFSCLKQMWEISVARKSCAAPGSKTAQLLEAIHNTDPNQAGETLANGLVIANDSNYERSQMLVHQAKRLQSPCLLVTHHEGQEFPRIFLTDRTSSEGATACSLIGFFATCLAVAMVRFARTRQSGEHGHTLMGMACIARGCVWGIAKLVRNQGLSIWKVKDKSGALYDKFDPEIESHRTTMHPSFFPPENASSLGLSKW
ncbi:hypothetical protein BASA83_002435 [Batrachochytrium salamandrivorans]|nr:hypothetical protein BASA83_002435 [Batrachochytrium salamandrivorans]